MWTRARAGAHPGGADVLLQKASPEKEKHYIRIKITMKKMIALCIAHLLFLLTANAQTEKGKWVISGQTNLSFAYNSSAEYMKSYKTKSGTFTLQPAVGYFVATNLAVGLSAAYTYSKADFSEATSTLALMPQAEYYFPLEGKARPFVTIGGGYARHSEGDSAIFKYDGFAAGGGAGVALFLKNNISLDLGAHYTYTQLENIQKRGYYVKNNGLGFLAGFSLFF